MTKLAWGASTHVGHIRTVNEDSFVAVAPVFAVADGMGGHERGEVASQLVADRLRTLAASPSIDPDAVVDALHEVHDDIRSMSDSSSSREMGTTVAAVVLLDGSDTSRWLMVNVGDSRLYRLVSHHLEQISVDHSVVQELVEAGVLTTEAARSHPDRNVITRAVGIGPELVADFALREIEPGERILLCSDGVHGQLSVEQIQATLVEHENPQDAATMLVEAVLAGRAPDNLTAIVIDVVDQRAPLDEVDETTSPRPSRADEVDSRPPPTTVDAPVDRPIAERQDPNVPSDDGSADDDGAGDFIRVPTW